MENKIERLTVEAVELLKEMISIPSPSFEEDAVCGHVCKWLTDHGVEHRRVGNNIIAEHIADPTRLTLMLCAHMDTVSPSPEYSFDPYKPENCPEDMVQGLGSNDDGASVVTMIAAYRYFTGHEGIGSGFQNNPSHSFVVGPTPCGQGGSTVREVFPDRVHKVSTPEAYVCIRVFSIDSFHQVRTVKVT